jgi:cytochrome P450
MDEEIGSAAPGRDVVSAGAGVRRIAAAATLTSLAEVRAAAKDWQHFSSRLQGDPDVRDYPQLPLEVDPPEHTAFRALLEPILGRRAIVPREGELRAIARELVGAFARAGRAEAVQDLAIPMVARTIATVFGRPDDADELTSWGMTSWEQLPDGTRSGARLDAYVERVLADGREDAFGRIASASIDGRPLTHLEQVGLANLILAGGRDTVIHTLLGAVWHLAQDPAARASLRSESRRLPAAIEEYLRYFSPNTGMERAATTDVAGEWGTAHGGDFVILGWGPANHDPRAFDAPGEIRLDRRPNPHVAFGSGPHTCIGIHLARIEVQVFLEELLAAVPDWRLAAGVAFDTVHLAGDEVPTLFQALPIEVGKPG